jgi:hypothetical protein
LLLNSLADITTGFTSRPRDSWVGIAKQQAQYAMLRFGEERFPQACVFYSHSGNVDAAG